MNTAMRDPTHVDKALCNQLATRSRAFSVPLFYGIAVIAIWSFYMLARRLMDFVIGFEQLNPLTLIPLLAMFPMLLPLFYSGFRSVPVPMRIFAWIWTGVFLLGFVVAIAGGDIVSGAFGFGDFILPMSFGLWLSARKLESNQSLAIFARAFAWCCAITSAYAVVQFVVVPPWDAAWMLNGGADGIGVPKPFEVRAFSTLTAPSTYAAFTACAMLMTLSQFRARPILYSAFLLLDALALALTSERSCWLALGVGMTVYLLLSPNRLRIAVGIVAMAIVATIVVSAVALSTPKIEATIQNLSVRISSLGDPSRDSSVRDREQQTDDAFESSKERPFGLGVGLFGVAGRLRTDRDFTERGWIDNGYLARLVELGWGGFAGYLAVTFGALAFTVRKWIRVPNQRDALAIAVAIEVVLIVLDGSHDHHSAFLGIVFWFMVAIAALAIPNKNKELASSTFLASR